MRSLRKVAWRLSLVLALSACSKEPAPAPPTATTSPTPAPALPGTPPPIERIQATPEAVAKAQEELQTLAERDRRMRASLSFEDFEATVYREPFAGGKYIVNGDTTIANRKQLLEFFDESVKPRQTTRLVLAQISGLDAKWNEQQKRKLTYCVSNTFGPQQAAVIQQMAGATGEWEKAAAVDFVHDSSQDASCGPSNATVVFDVRPVNVDGEYLARAFFPNEPRAARNVLIDESSFGLPANEKLQLGGILRHELGHTLGFRHEHTRPESGKCFEDKNWRPLTSYDAFSVMHYPQCNGKGDWSLNLTDKDKNATACLYGPAAGFTIDQSLVDIPCAVDSTGVVPGEPKTESFTAQSVAKGAQKAYGPFAAVAGTPLEVAMGGPGATGDPDLYVRFDLQPAVKSYDCRPYVDGPVEVCSITVPSNATRVFVMVRGYEQGTYDLRITHVPPASAGRGGTNRDD
jgi:serine protease